MDAYITKANAKRLVNNLDISNIDVNKEIFKIEFKWFNDYEVRNLLAFRLLFENPIVFFEQYMVRKAVDTKQYIYEGNLPSYHYSSDCGRLRSTFSNFKIPEEIKSKGDDKIAEFRIWFIDNVESLENNPDYFMERMRMRFNLKVRPEEVNYNNSGVNNFNNLNLNELESQITSLIIRANEYCSSSVKTQVILSNFGKISYIHRKKKSLSHNSTGFSNSDIWIVLEKFDSDFKEPIIDLLREYYRVKYNPEMKFEGKLLSQLGYKFCKKCEKEYYKDYNEKSFLEKLAIDFENSTLGINLKDFLFVSEPVKDVKLNKEDDKFNFF